MRLFTKTLLTLLMALFSITTLAAQQVPEVFSLRKIVLQADTDKAGFSKEVNLMNKELQTHGEGVGIALWEGDRGERSGELVHTWMFSTTERRNFYFPIADATSYPNLMAMMEKMTVQMTPDDPRVKSGLDVYTDYVCLGFDQIDATKGGTMVSLREFEVTSGMEDQFAAFVTTELHPKLQQEIEGLYLYIYKADRGEHAGKYIMVHVFDSKERRDTYFPEPDKPTEAFQAKYQKIKATVDKKQSFVKEGTGEVYTDYFMVL